MIILQDLLVYSCECLSVHGLWMNWIFSYVPRVSQTGEALSLLKACVKWRNCIELKFRFFCIYRSPLGAKRTNWTQCLNWNFMSVQVSAFHLSLFCEVYLESFIQFGLFLSLCTHLMLCAAKFCWSLSYTLFLSHTIFRNYSSFDCMYTMATGWCPFCFYFDFFQEVNKNSWFYNFWFHCYIWS